MSAPEKRRWPLGRILGRLRGSSSVHPASRAGEEAASPTGSDVSAPAFGGLDPRAIGQSKQQPMVDTQGFTLFMGAVVGVNLLTIGLETDMPSGVWKQIFALINNAFLLAYIAEMVLRLLTHGPAALQDQLTALDGLFVVVSFIERVMANNGFSRALPAFRLLRVLRLTTELKLLRGQRELQVLVASGRRTIKTLGWVSLTLLVAILACSGFTKIVIGDSAEWVGTMDPTVPHEPFESFNNREYFGSFVKSFLTLLQVVTRSQWADSARRIILVYPEMMLFFAFFLFVTSYGLVNCVVSNIVQQSIVAARVAQEVAADDAREARRRTGDQVLAILRSVDRDGDGVVAPEEINKALARTQLSLLLQDLSVPDFQGDKLIRLFDKDGTGQVTNEEIVEGLLHMDDEIKTRDYVRLSMWAKNCLMRAQHLGDKVGALSFKCHELRVTLEKAMEAMEFFKETKEVDELRTRAIRAIRSSPPGEAPRLRGWKPPVEPKYPPEDEAALFTGFARRLLGAGPFADDLHGREGGGPRGLGRRVELPPAPPPAQVAMARAREADRPPEDKYWTVRDPEKDYMPAPSVSLKTLRELVS